VTRDPITLRWYFDVISPFAALQWPKVKALAREREVTLMPVLLAAVLSARGQKGPAEIPGKREFTYRHALWQSRQVGVPLVFPPAHPFNPVAALRSCIAGDCTVAAVDAVFDWIWTQGRAGDSVQALAPLLQRLGIAPERLADDEIKLALRANTDAALAAGVFGVPTLRVGAELFWGNDATPMVEDWLADHDRFATPEYERIAALPVGVERRR